jgi:hypothetical protein
MTVIVFGAVGVTGAIALAIGVAVEPHRAFGAYLAAWSAAATIAIGALFMLLIAYAANARWPAVVRRINEAVALAIAPLAVLMIPLLIAAGHVWPWIDHAATLRAAPVARPAANAYLTWPGLVVRTAIYFAIFIVATELLVAWSRRRDREPIAPAPHGVDAMNLERRFSSVVIPIGGLAFTFASFDWLMSLQPPWGSTIFGLYVSIAGLAAGLAAVIVLAWRGVSAGAIPLTGYHFHAMGRLLLAFVVLWAYLAYFQAMLIQIANEPREVTFYIARTTGGWRTVTVLLVVLRFAIPFATLVMRRAKHHAAYTGTIAAIVLVGHYVDMWWLVIPLFGGPVPSWLDAAALCAMFGLPIAIAAWRTHRVPLLPIGDPYLQVGLDYVSRT